MSIANWKVYGRHTVARSLDPVELVALLEDRFALGAGEILCVYHEGKCLDVMTSGTETTSGGLDWIRRLIAKASLPDVLLLATAPYCLQLDLTGADLAGERCYCELSATLTCNPFNLAGLLKMLEDHSVLAWGDLALMLEERLKQPYKKGLAGDFACGVEDLEGELEKIFTGELSGLGIDADGFIIRWTDDDETFDVVERLAAERAQIRWKVSMARAMHGARQRYDLHRGRIELLTAIVTGEQKLAEEEAQLAESQQWLEQGMVDLARDEDELNQLRMTLDKQEMVYRAREKALIDDGERIAARRGQLAAQEKVLTERKAALSRGEEAFAKRRRLELERREKLAAAQKVLGQQAALTENKQALDQQEQEIASRQEELAGRMEGFQRNREELEAEATGLAEGRARLEEEMANLAKLRETMAGGAEKYDAGVLKLAEWAKALQVREQDLDAGKGEFERRLAVHREAELEALAAAPDTDEQELEEAEQVLAAANKDLARRRQANTRAVKECETEAEELPREKESLSGAKGPMKRAQKKLAKAEKALAEADAVEMDSAKREEAQARLEEERNRLEQEAAELAGRRAATDKQERELKAVRNRLAQEKKEFPKEKQRMHEVAASLEEARERWKGGKDGGAAREALEGEKTSLSAQRAALEREETELEGTQVSLAAREKALGGDEASVAVERSETTEENAATIAERFHLADREDGLGVENASLAEALVELHRDESRLETEQAGSGARRAVLEEELGRLEARLAEERERIEKGRATLAQGREKLEEVAKRLYDGETKIADDQARIREEQARLDERAATLEEAQRAHRGQAWELTQAQAASTASRNEMAEAAGNLAQQEARLAGEAAQLQKEHRALTAEAERLDAEEVALSREQIVLGQQTQWLDQESTTVDDEDNRIAAERCSLGEGRVKLAEEEAGLSTAETRIQQRRSGLEEQRAMFSREERRLAEEKDKLAKTDIRIPLCAGLGPGAMRDGIPAREWLEQTLDEMRAQTHGLKGEVAGILAHVQSSLDEGAPEWVARVRQTETVEEVVDYLGGEELAESLGDGVDFGSYSRREAPILVTQGCAQAAGADRGESAKDRETHGTPQRLSALGRQPPTSAEDIQPARRSGLALGGSGARQTATTRCGHCLGPIRVGSKICSNCGRKLTNP